MGKKDQILDITSDICPLTFVKAKLFIETLELGDVAEILLIDGEARHNVPRALAEQGHEILAEQPEGGAIYRLRVRKGRGIDAHSRARWVIRS